MIAVTANDELFFFFVYTYIYLFIYFLLAVLGLHCCMTFSSCGEGGFSLVVVCRLLIAVASLVVEHRL